MKSARNVLIAHISAISLIACTHSADEQLTYQPYAYSNAYFRQHYSNTIDYDTSLQLGEYPQESGSYHVGAYRSPISHKEVDREWVNRQNPQAYTIEIAEDSKPAQVASKLYKLPKDDRAAQIKYNKNGQTHYKGLYGSYGSYEEAQNALQRLPNDVKQSAGIQNWSKVQTSQ